MRKQKGTTVKHLRRIAGLVVSGLCILALASYRATAQYSFTRIVEDTGSLNFFSIPTINNAGQVVFSAQTRTNQDGIYRGDGEAITTIVDSTQPFLSFDAFPAINNRGQVAFVVGDGASIRHLYVGDGGPLIAIADSRGP